MNLLISVTVLSLQLFYFSTSEQRTNIVHANGTISFAPIPASAAAESFTPAKPVMAGGGLGGLYTLTNAFVDSVRSGSLPYDDVITPLVRSLYVEARNSISNSRSEPATSGSNARALQNFLNWGAGIIVLSVLGLVLAFCMPVLGLIMCCCRCCGQCGGNLNWSDKDEHLEKRQRVYCIVLLAFVLVFLALVTVGMVLSFVTNQTIQDGFDSALPSVVETLDTAEEFVNDALNVTSFLAVDQLSFTIGLVADQAANLSGNVVEPLVNLARPTVDNFADRLRSANERLNQALDNITDIFRDFQNNTSDVDAAFDLLNRELQDLRRECEMIRIGRGTCLSFVNGFNATQSILSDFVNDFFDRAATLRSRIPSGMNITLGMLDETVANIPTFVENATGRFIRSGSDLFASTLSNGFNSLETSLTDLFRGQDSPIAQIRNESFAKTVNDLSRTRYAFSIMFLILVLLVLGSVCVGLILGVAGFRVGHLPHERTSVSNFGGIWLLVSAGLIFFAAFSLFLLAAFSFPLGSTMRKFCLAVEDPEYEAQRRILDNEDIWGSPPLGSVIADFTDVALPFNLPGSANPFSLLNISVQDLFRNCEQNEPLYMAINGDDLVLNPFGIGQPVTLSKLQQTPSLIVEMLNLTAATEQLNEVLGSIMALDALDAVEGIVGSLPNVSDFDFSPVFAVGNTSLNGARVLLTGGTSSLAVLRIFLFGSALRIADSIRDALAAALTAVDALTVLLGQLEIAVQRIQMIVAAFIESLRADALAVIGDIQMGIMGFNSTIISIVNTTLESNLLPQVTQYVEYVANAVKSDALRCGPLSNAYIESVNLVCRQVANSMNGFWFSIGWCAIFFIPLVAFVIALSKHFRRHKELSENTGQNKSYQMETYYNPDIPTADNMVVNNNFYLQPM